MYGMLLATLEAMVSATGRWRTNIWQQSWVSLTTLPLVRCFPPPSQGKGRKLVRFVHPELRTKTKLGCSVHPRGLTIKGYTDSSRLLKFPGRPMFLLDWTSMANQVCQGQLKLEHQKEWSGVLLILSITYLLQDNWPDPYRMIF